jgi:hypothetical protein
MSILTILIVILLMLLILSIFNGGAWGYNPSYAVGIILLILVVLILTGNVNL